MLRVCLTGGIASGKSLVSDRFRALGVPVADSDEAARAVVAPGTPGLAQVTETFGADVLDGDGTLDRRALRARIFSDANARRRLEAILHPLIRERLEHELESWSQATEAYAIEAIPLLVETGRHRECTHILVVDAPPTTQIERLMHRDRCSECEARAILDQQASRWDRLSTASEVIDNADDVPPGISVTPQVLALHRVYLALAAHRSRGKESAD